MPPTSALTSPIATISGIRHHRGRATVPARDAVSGPGSGSGALTAVATARRNLSELPGDAEVLERIKYHGGDALENLVAAGAVPPAGVLPVGLSLLSALAQLCRSDSASILQRAA